MSSTKLLPRLLPLILLLALGCSPINQWARMNRQIGKYFHLGKYLEATETAQQALSFAERSFGSSHLHVATSLGNLVFLYNLQGEYQKARTLLNRALAIKELELGP
jgi:tetratricopeptide (TPR) repeat protein